MEEFGFKLSMEHSIESFLGIKFEELTGGAFNMTQPALIQKIITTTGMQGCNGSPTPAAPNQPLGKDPDGEPMDEEWSYPSVIGMLLYLSTNTRPDICYAVSQVARFTHSPKQSHASAVKRIVRYLSKTSGQGTIMRPDGTLSISSMSDSDFAGLYNVDPVDDVSSAKSRMGYIISLGGCPLVWKSKVLSSVCLATAEAEYYCLSHCLRVLLPIREVLKEIVEHLGASVEVQSAMSSKVFGDNAAAMILGRTHRLTARTRYYHTAAHHFWQHVDSGDIVLEDIESAKMDADYFTKGMPREGFEANRRCVQGW
ncbi:Retrovirus-related Pol polyprotein from transposon [Seminavis robusta]|uniref:Retrovirus-related Pol polyprotein from transposon n=1 Tax=Seminavis robusta TaxID=568900 RepID=A0A9N8HVX7_9STRA|nr:Retrovirus-related Pol polyprotein from transposon [Seminavis robusta]|eukprot:Sro2023_g311550.1 Retrovirus-related Pol polyprotein from transposon (312) ;mRNA; r:4217-5152